ncbi:MULTISPECIES: flagellar hook-basal body complex protein FliE [Rhizobium]|jgi:flagellar hook-basal body complex protein FliE|uniref:Flagellar hook-basal body complex protein FliE n=1 Tax=Rhizobium lusitanum TaxID=293958 RepID=A0A1C3WL76_9HYPH|nr:MULTISPECIES: flagellar hook-basal body complex protein FliE [Rhizobium]NKJ05243.1 flagellar hook-basal body complex protein FliE [Rhizobium sp. SG741]NKJ38954.1 flagellar hook-basal body complex protein FliE [Rhizobium sp. SG570]NTJ05977.1 flagellar hook-basal body complex protein FliE [Rhizobium lusitanum]SCB40720.1 flagellar hook-basal body complex protein FliE [Rhizobium lusitanum]
MIDSIKNVASLSATRGLGSIATDLTSAASGVLGSSPAVAMGTTAGMSFASVMSNVAKDSVNTLKEAENASFAGMKGQMSTREVVDKVMQADQTLQTAIALRDKLVSAFLDVTKMQI